MNYKCINLDEFYLVGFMTEIGYDDGYKECPLFWEKIGKEYFCSEIVNVGIKDAIVKYNIGEYAVCVDEKDGHSFKYMIAGISKKKVDIDGLECIKIDESKWMKFTSHGALPNSLQNLNDYIFKTWLKDNEKYELAKNISLEWYSDKDPSSDDYVFGILIPVKEK